MLLKILKWSSCVLVVLLAAGVGFVSYTYSVKWRELPTEQEIISHYNSDAVAGAETFIHLNEFDKHVPRAVLAAENSNYLTDGSAWGSCLWLVTKSIIQTGLAPRGLQGCGHNFPKLILKTLFPIDSPLWRSLSIVIFVRKTETVLSREQIFSWLLNEAYFGRNSYGISQAAKTFFQKPADRLTIAQAAMLAGLLRAPSTYDPIRHPSRAKTRRDHVLSQMLQRGMITGQQYQAAIKEDLEQ